jgi:dolichol-phosphate mannosyltransferase
MKLSVLIPAYNEEDSLEPTVRAFYGCLAAEGIDHEIVVIDDNSSDGTAQVLARLAESVPTLVWYTNPGPNGFGLAIRYGLDRFTGDAVAIVMADLSDDPHDLVTFYRTLCQGYDCVFGSRFIRGGAVYDYPYLKLRLNRLANFILRVCFGLRYNDITNAFKLYRRETIQGLRPFLAPHFNLTIELPLKAIIRGYTYTVVPNSWRNRKAGVSKLKIREMGSRYFFIMLYCLIEKYFSKGDFKKKW